MSATVPYVVTVAGVQRFIVSAVNAGEAIERVRDMQQTGEWIHLPTQGELTIEYSATSEVPTPTDTPSEKT